MQSVKATKPCVICGQVITDYVSARRQRVEWTCSPHCAGLHNVATQKARGTWQRPPPRRRNGDEVACRHCGQVFYRDPADMARNRQFCSRACWYASPDFGRINATRRARTGRKVDASTGYVRIRCADGQWRLEHRVIAAEMLGRPLAAGEQVHHKNAVKDDNRPENLEVVATADHVRLTMHKAAQTRRAIRAELEEYRRRYGPLEPEA